MAKSRQIIKFKMYEKEVRNDIKNKTKNTIAGFKNKMKDDV